MATVVYIADNTDDGSSCGLDEGDDDDDDDHHDECACGGWLSR